MPFCQGCGEDVPHFQWNTYHGCCTDCVAMGDKDRHREQGFWCPKCQDFCESVEMHDLSCTACGTIAERRYKS